MSVQSEINRINQNVANTYTSLSGLGATVPSSKNSDNLPATVNSLNGKLDADTVDGWHVQVGTNVTPKTGHLTFIG
ncbi:MAG: hypothetical protein IKJ27_00265 [Clostridia bacterium]|nr:hypothetical protein [Clostridia bacterium]